MRRRRCGAHSESGRRLAHDQLARLGSSAPTCRCACRHSRCRARHRRRSNRSRLSRARAGAGQSRRRGADAGVFPALTQRENAGLPPLPRAFDSTPRTGWRRPATISSRAARSIAPVDRRCVARARQGGRGFRPHVGIGRNLLRPVRNRQCGQARRGRNPPPPARTGSSPHTHSLGGRRMARLTSRPSVHPGRHRGADRLRHAQSRRRQVRPDAGRPHRRGRPSCSPRATSSPTTRS